MVSNTTQGATTNVIFNEGLFGVGLAIPLNCVQKSNYKVVAIIIDLMVSIFYSPRKSVQFVNHSTGGPLFECGLPTLVGNLRFGAES